MKSALKTTLVILAVAVIAIGCFRYGRWYEAKSTEHMLSSVQALLSFNHFKAYEEIEEAAKNGCAQKALGLSQRGKNQQLMIISRYAGGQSDPSTLKYMTDRDPDVLAKAEKYDLEEGALSASSECAGAL